MPWPPRKGDPSLNHLSFPAGVRQSFHIHPSIRLGVVANGSGFACFADREMPLTAGTLFCIEERELHRFRTEDQRLDVIAFHPDGDWGPTDQDHPMLNRTYLSAARHE
jgi:mannose-6-phosphate isomerase-like protein (cupin superfamily)